MPGELSVYGLGSGIDWSEVVEKLIAVSHRPIDLLEQTKSEYQNKLTAWQMINTDLLQIKDLAEELSTSEGFNLFTVNLSQGDENLISVSTSSSASPGIYTLRVLSKAQAEAVEGKSFNSSNSSLGLSGIFLVNGQAIEIETSDTLSSIAGKINQASAGVTAQVVQVGEGYRLKLTANAEGASGIALNNASSNDLLLELGLGSAQQTIAHYISNGVESQTFADSTTAIGSLLGISSSPSGTIQVAGVSVDIDLSTDSLEGIANKINQSWSNAGNSGNIASVLTAEDGGYKLQIYTTNLSDSGNVLETLDVLRRTREPVTEVLQSSSANTSGGNPITLSTLITDIDTDTGHPQVGETITIKGTDHNGNTVEGTFTISDSSTVQDLLTQIENTFGNTITASVTPEGKLQFTDNTTGESQLSIQLIANNEQGGGLNFGNIQTVTEGRNIEISKGRDAQIEIDGRTVTSSSNAVSNIVPGVTINILNANPDQEITLSIDRDIDQIANKIKDFIDKTNDVLGYIREQRTYEEGKTKPLAGDSTLMFLEMDITDKIYAQVEGLDPSKNFVAWAGITMGEDGKFSVDMDKLKETLSSDFESVKDLFISTDNREGIASRMDDFLDFVTDEYGSGYVHTHIEALQDHIQSLDKEIAEKEAQRELEKERLYQQFNALESFMAQMHQTSIWLSQQIAKL